MRGGRICALSAALALALVATGCASVRTDLSVKEDGSGTREMAVAISQESLESSEVSIDDVEKSVKKHLPEELSYDGRSKKSEDGEDAVVLRFTLEYDDLEDYEDKVASLLKDSGKRIDPRITQTQTDSDLVEGVHVEENFSSADLLGWVESGLQDDDVVEENEIQVDSSQEDPDTVEIGGESYDSEGMSGDLRVEEVSDHGFGEAELVLHPTDDPDRFEADLELTHRSEPDKVTRERVEPYFKDRLPEGATLEATSSESYGYGGYRVDLGEGTLQEIAQRLQKVTGEDSVSLESSTSSVPADPLAVERSLTYRLEATELLSPKATDSSVSVTLDDGEDDAYDYGNSATGTQGEITTQDRVQATSLDHEVTLHGQDDVEVVSTYVLPREGAEQVRESVEKALRPSEGQGRLEVSETEEGLAFSVHRRGTPGEVTHWSGQDARITVSETEGGLRPRSEVSVDMSGLATALQGEIATAPSLTVHLPGSATVEQDDVSTGRLDGETVKGDDLSTARFEMQSVTVGWWVLLGALALGALALLAVLFFFRRRIASALSGAWGRRDQVVARARTTAGAVAGAGAAAGAAAGASLAAARSDADGVPADGDEEGPFHESQLR